MQYDILYIDNPDDTDSFGRRLQNRIMERRLAMANDHHPQYIPERLLQAAINKQVSEKLGSLGSEIGEFTKGMTEADAMEAKLMVLEMVRNAFGEFYTKMKARIESKGGKSE